MATPPGDGEQGPGANAVANAPSRVARAARIGAAAVQLGALLFAIEGLEVGGAGFFRVAALAYGGALLRCALPHRHRLALFVALSAAGLILVLGWQAGWVAGVGLAILATCRLPVSHAVRTAVLCAFALALCAMRAGWCPAPWRAGLWPVLGSMFCFRSMVYLHDLRHEGRAWDTKTELAYFFMLPNIGQALFPVIDFKAFRRTYDSAGAALSGPGIAWMTRGLLHVILYRAVYLYGTIPPAEILSIPDLARHAASGFALYLRLSGTFHLVVGMLLLFGWNLPPTHDHYFLATGVNDLWRRINITWKDFMQRLFFYPAYFHLRGRSQRLAIVLGTLYVIAATWVLHGVQWFWIAGSFPMRWQDALFWSLLGGLMCVSSLRELAPRAGIRRAASGGALRTSVARWLRVGATFVGMATLWSMWSSDSLTEWAAVWAVLGEGWAPPDAGWMMGPMSLAVACALLAIPPAPNSPPVRGAAPTARPAIGAAVTLVALVALAIPGVWVPLGGGVVEVVSSLAGQQLNQVDAARVQRGYYEDLLNANGFNALLWEVGEPPSERPFVHTAAARDSGDYRWKEMAPYVAMTYHGQPFHTNAWGMRDRDYTRAKPPGTYRIALIGASPEMGASVGDGETYEQLVEDRLNREHTRVTGLHYEILNFGVGQYSPIHRLMSLESEALPFTPDAALYVAHPEDFAVEKDALARAYGEGKPLPTDPELLAIFDRAGLRAGLRHIEVERRLAPRARELEAVVMRKVAQRCRAAQVRALWALLPSLGGIHETNPAVIPLPPTGFVILDLSWVYGGHDRAKLMLHPQDFHPNAFGHRLIADRLYAELLRTGLPQESR